MRGRYLEVTFRQGRPIAAYLLRDDASRKRSLREAHRLFIARPRPGWRRNTPYSAASSVSRSTLRPRRTTMDLAIRSAGISAGAVCLATGSRASRVQYIQPE